MIDKLLMMLRDPDYRVRLSLAKRIGILFQTWDGHDDLFQDIWCVAKCLGLHISYFLSSLCYFAFVILGFFLSIVNFILSEFPCLLRI